jgi:hypothetical protein
VHRCDFCREDRASVDLALPNGNVRQPRSEIELTQVQADQVPQSRVVVLQEIAL